jgi:putative ABC transport system ATP-binding protein
MDPTGARVLRRTISRNGLRVACGSALLVVHQLCEVAVPVLIGVIVDRAVATGSVGAIVLWIGVLAGLFVALTAAFRLGARLLQVAIARESHRLRNELASRSLDPSSPPPTAADGTPHGVGELLSIATTDADNTTYVIDYVARVAAATAATVACGVILLVIDVPLGLVVLVGIPLVVVGLQLSAPVIARRVEVQQATVGQTSGLATDLVTGLRPLQGLGATDAASHRYRRSSRTALRAAVRAAVVQNVHTGLSTAIGFLAAMTVAVAAVVVAVDDGLGIGQLIVVVGLAQFLVEPFSVLAIVPSWIAEARASSNRVARVLGGANAAGTAVDTPPSDPGAPALSIRADQDTLRVAVDVAPGEFVALLATSPADAAAMVEALSGGSDADVAVHGVPLSRIPSDERHRRLLVAPHESHVFTGSVRSNVDWPAEATDDLTAVLAASAADDVVAGHPDGLDRPVSERGSSLSGGQRQRVALARALLAAPHVLVLHDPTTAVDSVTEHAVAQGIRSIRAGAESTTVVVTSSPPLLAAADRVVVIDDGAVVADGPHRRLVVDDVRYRAAVTR